MINLLIPAALLLLSLASFFGQVNAAIAASCGELVTIETHDRTTTRYALANPKQMPPQDGLVALVLLVGGGGHLDLDSEGCPRALNGNSLVRSLPHFHRAGFATALVDAPSDHPGEDGLAGFRVTAKHADDLGKVINDVKMRTKASVWLIGTSRGSISAANAAASLSGPSAPDGLVLTSALMSGFVGGQKPWVADTVFSLPLEAVRIPVLVVGHAEDMCPRSPPERMTEITARTNGVREQTITVMGGPAGRGRRNLSSCVGRTPHGFLGQEADVVAGIARFIHGASY